jgi:hypothetical protein
MADTTTKYDLPYPEGGVDFVKDGATAIQSLAEDIDDKFAGYSEGPIDSRPTSTGGTPGIAGRIYRATDTGRYYVDNGTGWDELVRQLRATATWNPGSIGPGESEGTTVAVTGAVVGQPVVVSSTVVPENFLLSGFVVSSGQVYVQIHNISGSTVDPSSGTLDIRVLP